MPSRRTEHSRRAVRWLAPAALLALAPKCLLCVLAYAGVGAALGLGGPEMCGAPTASSNVSLAWLLLPVVALAFSRSWRCPRSVGSSPRERNRSDVCPPWKPLWKHDTPGLKVRDLASP